MAAGAQHDNSEEHASSVSPGVLNMLELLDNIAHVLVAVFFIVLASSVLIYSSLLLLRGIPLIVESPHVASAPISVETTSPSAHHEEAAGKPEAGVQGSVEQEHAGSPFLHSSLELLSTLLFAVIVLELLKTIITYLKTHNIQAIMKEFLVVGIISSIRKILLVGAESSLAADPTAAYIKEATGTIITIAGILLLIVGLILLQRSEDGRWKAETGAHAP